MSKRSMFVLLVVGIALLLSAGTAAAAAPQGPYWAVKSVALPTNFAASDAEHCRKGEGCDAYQVTITNVGASAASVPVIIHDRLPAGYHIVRFSTVAYLPRALHRPGFESECTPEATGITCKYEGPEGPEVEPGTVLGIRIEVIAGPEAQDSPFVANHIEVRGGGAPPVEATVTNPVNGPLSTFAVQDFSSEATSFTNTPEDQAGGHPTGDATSLSWTTFLEPNAADINAVLPVDEPKTQVVDLPPGFVADAQALGHCPVIDVEGTSVPGRPLSAVECPADSQIGWIELETSEGGPQLLRLYNVPPEAGYPAEFAFEYVGNLVTLLPRLLPSRDGYVLSVSAPGIPRVHIFKVTGATAHFFGNPAEHDGSGTGEPFFTNPDDCSSAPLKAKVELNSWLHPDEWVSKEATMFEASSTQAVSGCQSLVFAPSIAVTPETRQADTPSGYEIDLSVPQSANMPGTLATPDLKDAVVSLPAGTSVSPSAANGLVACQASGPEGIELGSNDPVEADKYASRGELPEGEEIGPDGLVHPAPGHCPAASQVGEVEVVSPDLAHPLTGHVFVAAPQCGNAGQPACTPQSAEDGQLFGIYLEVAGEGIVVKLKGKVSVNPQTGRVTTSFDENPQLPFSELKLKLGNGPRAPLANPQSCGTATTNADFTPWSTPYTPDVTPSSSFAVTGCGGGFSPSFAAGMASTLHAGSYSPFTLSFSRHDGEQDLSGLTVNMPAGLIGKIAGFAQCGNAEVAAAENNTGGCPAASQVGTATAAAGAGSTPFYQSGPVYLTGPYNGAPFGLAVVVPANAGPFHLGNIVVRAAIHINPNTAQVSVVSNPLPQSIDGVPLRVQTVNVTVGQGDNFTFNPTNCSAESIGATISSAQGAAANVSSPFQATGCASLPFKPVFSASTAGKASKAGGASLDVKVSYPKGAYANIKSVKVDLPEQLPSRLTTLQKACLARVFEANPANCPADSDVGTATATTPLLNVPISGPAYLVSHGNEAFPDLEIVLQGEGVQIVLDGNTDIKKGITSSTFKSIPDAPVSSFELKLPTGKFSILGSNVPQSAKYSLCGQTLNMPTVITGQNGAVVKQTTKIGVTGCPKAKTVTKKKKKPAKATRRAK